MINKLKYILLLLALSSQVALAKNYEVWLGTPDKSTSLNAEQTKQTIKVLREADVSDTVTININSVGGDTLYGVPIIEAIRTSNAEVVTRCIDECLSYGAFILMAGDDIRIKHGAILMFHTLQFPCATGYCPVSREYAKKYPQVQKDFEDIYGLYKQLDLDKILLPSEWEDVWKGKNVFITQLQMRDRMNRYFNSRR